MTTTNSDAGIFKTGDIVVGSSDPSKSVYSATGSKIIHNGVSIYGNEKDIQAAQKELHDSIQRNGGKQLQDSHSSKTSRKTSNKKTTSKRKIVMQTAQAYFENDSASEYSEKIPAAKLQTIQFENAFGKMKAKVEHVVDHEAALMLVFKDADSMVFEPKTGETLLFYSNNGSRYDVYYPGVTFDSPDSSKKYMILFKVPEEN